MNRYPINEYIVKVASRCNLNCDYCYEYNLGDVTWKRQPKFITLDTIELLGRRIGEHARTHNVPEVFVSLHGGEPLLMGAERLDELCDALKREIGDATSILFTMQTNATLINESNIDVIRRHGISVSVSVDGYQEAHDRHRVDHHSNGSFDQVDRGIRALRDAAPECLTGLLAVIDLRNDPLRTFDAVAQYGIDWIDFLLPHHHWDRPPPRPSADPVAYGRWYWDIYEAWIADRHPTITVRFLANLVSQLVGDSAVYEANTLEPCTLVTVATNGEIEAVDCLKSTPSGAQVLGHSLQSSSFDDVLGAQAVSVRQSGEGQLALDCRQCTFKKECAGGYFPHRWGRNKGFDNPSVYCSDLFWLSTQIKKDLLERKRHQQTLLHSPS